MTGVAHPPWSHFNQWRTAKFCRDRRPPYRYGAGLTVVPVLSWPTPPGPRPRHGGKRAVVPSLLVRVSLIRAHLRRSTNRERLTSPDRVAPQASSANARPLRHLSHAARAHSSCRYCGPSAASGSPGGGRCPPRTVFLRRAQRLAAQSANVTGSHVLASLAVPHRALPFVLGCHLVRAYGAHEHVSTPRLPTPPAPSSSASTPQQRAHPHSQVLWPSDLS